ncbi:MAG: enoyl-CoA hydratase-related protein [Pseudomonadota bacterium]
MTDLVRYAVRDGVAILQINNPPSNALSHGVRVALQTALDRADADADVRAVILTAAGRTFPVGADIREMDRAPQPPLVGDVARQIEAMGVPVVVAIHGRALGLGLELALAGHARIAARGASLGLPEISLGLIPSAGATQRLPRLVAGDVAGRMILTGRPLGAEAAQEAGLIDGIIDGDLMGGAMAFAQNLAQTQTSGPPVATSARRDGFRDAMAYRAALEAVRAELPNADAPVITKAMECLEAAPLLPFDAGLALEDECFEEVRRSPEAMALRHVFVAERRAARVPRHLPEVERLAQAAVLGGGLLGAGIALNALEAGLQVVMVEAGPEAATAAAGRVSALAARAVAQGRLTPARRDEVIDRLRSTADLGTLRGVDAVLVAGAGAVNATVFARVAAANANAVLVSVSAFADLSALDAATGGQGRVVACNILPPSHVTRLAELALMPNTPPEIEARAFHLIRRIGKTPVRIEHSPKAPMVGLVVERLLAAYRRASDALVATGATPHDVDRAMRGFGFNVGPYQVQDLIGFAEPTPAESVFASSSHDLRGALRGAGRTGQAKGAGFYDYAGADQEAMPSDEVQALIEAHRAATGIRPRRVSDTEIVETCLDAMVNAGVACGPALRQLSDVDIAAILGLGFPRHRGGPLKSAEVAGVLAVERRLSARAEASLGDDVAFWTPHPALRKAVLNGARFGDDGRG